MKRLAFLILSVFVSLSAQAEPTKQEISLKVVQDYVIPAYEELALHAGLQQKVWQTTCDPAPLKQAYQASSDAWAKVQHLNFGPITLLLRRDRLYHWPERRNATGKGVDKLLADQNSDKLSGSEFANTSVAVQGFPALERLLYSDRLKGGYGCQLGRAIADNIAQIARETAKEWQETLVYIEKAEAHPFYFETMDEVAIRLYTEYLTGFQMITDQKLALPLGTKISKANGKRAEGWRAQRSTLNLQQSVLGLEAMARPFLHFLSKDSQLSANETLAYFRDAAMDLPVSIKEAVGDEAKRAQLLAFKDVAKKTRLVIMDLLTKEIDLSVGFNSLDGD